MGLIFRQSAKHSTVRYIATAIGLLSTIFIYSKDTYSYGLLGFIIDTSLLLSPLVIIGLHSASIRFFPLHTTDSQRRELFLYIIQSMMIATICFSILFSLIEYYSPLIFSNNSKEYLSFFIYILPCTVFVGFNLFLSKFISNYGRIAVTAIIDNFLKVSLPFIFLLIFYDVMSYNIGLLILLSTYIIICFSLLFYLYTLDKVIFDIKVFSKWAKPNVNKREILNYSSFAFLGGVGSMLAFRIDGFMIPTLTDFEISGEYRLAFIMTSIITIPAEAIFSITSPIISSAWKSRDFDKINSLYKKSSNALLIVGAVVTIALLSSTDLIVHIMAGDHSMAILKQVIIIISCAKIIDMIFGINGQILMNSAYYKYNLLFILLLGVVNMVMNYFLISKYGPIGAAVATLFAMIVFNLLKYFFLKIKMGLDPFSTKTFLLGMLALGQVICLLNFKFASQVWIDACAKLIIYCGSFILLSYRLKVSEDINLQIDRIINKLKSIT